MRKAELQAIQTFPSLIRFLRDEMGWPIDSEDFEELTFDYTPEELGIDKASAAKIEGIKRLRPLAKTQPWGIFFVKFERKRLPVVALRRILSRVVLKKRASANAADRVAWCADDLLFVSNYGEGEARQISFAHFSTSTDGHDLPTLKVLGWDNLDTALHLDAVAQELTEHLAWPSNEADIPAWREQWRAAFTLEHREAIETSKELSIRLAALARAIRDRLSAALSIETDTGPLTRLMKAFQTALVHDLESDGFADMYAQTIAYGLLSARIADPHKKTVDDFAGHMRTNPFLRELMDTFMKAGGRRDEAGGPGIDFDELGVSEVVDLLDAANMEAVVRDFGDRNPQEDPVIHFYELFLKEYDAKKRLQRGVFYTPRPVVAYIVRSVDELLRTEFGLEDGLADTATWGEMASRHKSVRIPDGVPPLQGFVQILDPATGTGTFLVEVIDFIHKALVAKWKKDGRNEKQLQTLWNEYVPRHLLTRLHGYELLMAPYAIAHLKVGLKLYETGYRFGSDERAGIYLTNALEPWVKQLPLIGFPALAHEAAAVNEVKRHKRFTVVIGNPPYSNYGQLNKNPYILGLLETYKRGLQEKKLNLDDDFIKFVRFAQDLVEATGRGVLGMITSNVFLDGITHRRMREALVAAFDTLRILDLHGSSKKQERAPDGSSDENVFDIQQGVAISLFVRSKKDGVTVEHSDLFGIRETKYLALGSNSTGTTPAVRLESTAPHFFFVPKSFLMADEYDQFISLTELFVARNAGIQTKNDGFVYALTRCEMETRIGDLRTMEADTLTRKYGLTEDGHWDISAAQKDIRENKGNFVQVLNRPFDKRWTYYTGKTSGFMARPRSPVMRAGLIPNRMLVAVRNPRRGNTDSVFVADTIVDKDGVSPFDNATVFPFVLPGESEEGQSSLLGKKTRPNISVAFTTALQKRLPSAKLESSQWAEGAFAWVYAVLHSGTYRAKYREFLKIDFPRIPLPGSFELFDALGHLGRQLIALHLMESPKLSDFISSYRGPKSPSVERVGWSDGTVWVDAGRTSARDGHLATVGGSIGFHGIPKEVWQFHIGGYQVCFKWLTDRKGRRLAKDDLEHYQRVIVALKETIRLMQDIDQVIDARGGWPGAFQTAPEKAAAPTAQAEVFPFRPRIVEPKAEERYVNCVPLVPLKAAAGAFGDPQHIQDGDSQWAAVETRHRLRPGMFVAQVVGKSMEPAIPDGAYCLFRAPVEGTRQGKTVLVQLRDATDPETGERYTVKRYEGQKTQAGESWRHAKITLKPQNPAFQPIVLTNAEEGLFQVIAECIEVLGGGS